MSLRLIALGGTFDKVYDPRTGTLGFGRSCLPEMLEAARIHPPPPISALMLVDSLDMGEAHRQTVVSACRHCAEEALVIIHGTDTMTDTAATLAAAGLEKCVVLTGAMVPARFGNSDAAFNLGFAAAAALLLPHGVWIAIGGAIHAWDEVRKNRDSASFERIEPPADDQAGSPGPQ
ncbi:MAG: asparaginase domain-containing protein [Burkholderiaceae bacterium]